MPGLKRQRTNTYGTYKRRGAFQFKAPQAKRYSKIYQKVSPERKFFETAISFAVGAGAGLIEDSLVHISQGTEESQRVGRSVTLSSLHIRGVYNFVEHATVSADACRFIVYLDKQTNGATAAVTDILETADEKAYRNLSNTGRFEILADRYFTINSLTADGASNYGQVLKPLNINIPFKQGIKIEYNNTTGNITEIRSNNIGLLWINQGATSVTATARVRYLDS